MKRNKFNIIFIIPIFAFLITLTGCINLTSVKSNEDTKVIEVGEVFAISSEKGSKFESSNSDIAKVTEDGIVTGIGVGTAEITITTDTKTNSITITVIENGNNVSIKCDCKQTIEIGSEEEINATVTNTTDNFIFTYLSNDPSVATVSDKGVIKGISTGIALITIKASGTIVISKDLLVYVKGYDGATSQENIIENKSTELVGEFDLTYLNSKVKDIVNTYKESVVGVSNYQTVTSYFKTQLVEAGVGTGFIFKKDNLDGNSYKYYVLTNHHVVEKAEKLKIYFGYDDEYIDCDLLASNSTLDIAVITFTSSKEYTLLNIGSIDDVSLGDFAIAIGNANGYEYFGSVTFGIVSYVNRVLEGESAYFIQHDVAINPGNSGGPLLDLNGNVIGINTLKIVDSDVDNMGFAISIDTVKQYLETLNLL